MRIFILSLTMLLCALSSQGENKESAVFWSKANQFYNAKNYDSAIALYKQLLPLYENNDAVHFNLANAYYKANIIGQAIVHYEKCLFYNPLHPFAQANLSLTQQRIPNSIKPIEDIFFVKWWHSMTAGHHTNTWSLLSLIIFLSISTLLIFRILNKYQAPIQLLGLLPVALIITLTLAYLAAHNKLQSKKAVTTAAQSSFLTAPNEFKNQRSIPEGTTVAILKTQGNWVEVSLPNKRQGWMQKNELTFVDSNTKN